MRSEAIDLASLFFAFRFFGKLAGSESLPFVVGMSASFRARNRVKAYHCRFQPSLTFHSSGLCITSLETALEAIARNSRQASPYVR
jgi:hypothetical protein